MSKEAGAFAAAALLGFVGVGMVLYPTRAPGHRLTTLVDWEQYASEGHRMGPKTAPVTIVEFSDFQCPYCKQLESTLATLYDDYPGQVALVYRNYPLTSLHPAALPAAIAAECAGEQGRFFPYHTALFSEQESIGRVSWAQFALRARVTDIAAFNACVADQRTLPLVKHDLEVGQRLHIDGTPLVLVNGVQLSGAPSRETLDSLIRHVRLGP